MAFSIFRSIVINYSLLSAIIAFAGAQEEIFLKANAAYQKKDFQKAFTLYESMQEKGAAVWYNMALCSYYLEKPASAVAYLNRALKQADRADYWQIKKTVLMIKPETAPIYRIIQLAEYVTTFFSILYWQIIILIFALILFCVSTFNRLKSRVLKAFCTCCLLLASSSLYYKQMMVNQTIGTTADSGATLYTGPGDNFCVKATIPATQRVIVLQENNSWYKVRYGKIKGWLQAHDVII